jgi:hypothetical protein
VEQCRAAGMRGWKQCDVNIEKPACEVKMSKARGGHAQAYGHRVSRGHHVLTPRRFHAILMWTDGLFGGAHN